MCQECHGNEADCASIPHGTIIEPEAITSAHDAPGSAAELAPALPFDTCAQLQCAASSTARTVVEPSVGASRECAANPAGYSECTSHPADAAGADNHGRITGASAPALSQLDVRCSMLDVRCSPFSSPLQPIADIPSYLEQRSRTPHFTAEDRLFPRLPIAVKADLRLLLGVRPGGGVFGHIQSQVKAGLSVTKSVAEARLIFKVPGSLARLRERYDLWVKTKDWVCLVNKSKAGAAWQTREDGLSALFLEFCATRLGEYAREDGKRQALLSIKRQWITGRNEEGEREPIPGYGPRPVRLNGRMVTGGYWQDWFEALGYKVLGLPRRPRPSECPGEPTGWSDTNIRKQIKSRNLFSKAVRALLHEGPAAARTYLPQVHFDRNAGGPDGTPMRFLQVVEFDDVKCDFLVIDPVSGQVCDLWLLIARDKGTAILLGFGMRPAKTREDGSQEHLRLRDMKQLCGWILERYDLPPYEMIWKLEHGTATLPPAVKAALRELLPGSIDISYNKMIGGQSPTGYGQRAVGNSKAKASLESHNRLQHTMLSRLAGQTGKSYGVRPADLAARAKESVAIFESAQQLPEHLRKEVGYSVLTLDQAREHLFRCFQLQNQRTEHELQGFEDVVEIWDGQRWVPQSAIRDPQSAISKARTRKESPLERCARLVAPYRGQWRQISPDIITAFYEHTVRQVIVKPNGLIEDRGIQFMPPPSDNPQSAIRNPESLAPGTKCLAYSHPDDPAFMHLTDGKGRILGTWLRRSLAHDHDTVQRAIRYSQSALKAAKEVAATYATDRREQLEDMRARNAELMQANTFVAVASPLSAIRNPQSAIRNPVAAALVTLAATTREELKAEKQQRDIEGSAAADDLLRALSAPEPQ